MAPASSSSGTPAQLLQQEGVAPARIRHPPGKTARPHRWGWPPPQAPAPAVAAELPLAHRQQRARSGFAERGPDPACEGAEPRAVGDLPGQGEAAGRQERVCGPATGRGLSPPGSALPAGPLTDGTGGGTQELPASPGRAFRLTAIGPAWASCWPLKQSQRPRVMGFAERPGCTCPHPPQREGSGEAAPPGERASWATAGSGRVKVDPALLAAETRQAGQIKQVSHPRVPWLIRI